MTKETFLKELEKNLKYLSNETKTIELAKYESLANYDLDPITEANNIYQRLGLAIKINKKTKFLDSVGTIINELQSKDKKHITNILLFFLYLLFLLIILKIPFIYVRDITSSIFNNIFSDDTAYMLWSLLFELLYAITTIIVFIRLINKKANELENDAK